MSSRRWPIHGWIGLALVAVMWPLNWGLEGMRSHVGFFPLWLGYCLTVDALFALYHLLAGLVGRGREAYVLPREALRIER